MRDLSELDCVSISTIEGLRWFSHWSSLERAITSENLKRDRKKLREAVEYLCKYGAGVDKRDLYKRTPLWYAISIDDGQVVDLLLRYGADKMDPCGQSYSDHAKKSAGRDVQKKVGEGTREY